MRADLRTPEGVEQLHAAVTAPGARSRPPRSTRASAGAGRSSTPISHDEIEIIDLNVTSTVRLAKLVLRDMAARDEGRVLITSSIASTMPGSFQAVYNASKSFLQSFAEALQNELKDTGVTITSLMPGPTATDFFRRADMLDTKVGSDPNDDPALVAKQGFEALMEGKDKMLAAR